MTLAATVVLSLLPQVFPGGDLKLPPTKPSTTSSKPEVRPLSEVERFRRDLLDMSGTRVKVERKLDEMGRRYEKIEELILRVARDAKHAEMRNLMPVARRYGRISGSPRVADELLFQLLARRLGPATHVVVETMAELKGKDAKAALQKCVRARVAAVRRHAVDVLGPMCTEEDLQFALALSREQKLDFRLRAIDLLEAIGTEPAVERLIELLSKNAAMAGASCRSLMRLQGRAVPLLQQRVAAPAIDRSYVYAAFALAEISDATGEQVLPAELLEPLQQRLQAPEVLTRVLAAVPLADIVYRSAAGEGGRSVDLALVETLLQVVEPQSFVPNIDMLRVPAEQRLLRHTGRMIAGESALGWRTWWGDHRDSFLGVRAHVRVDASNAATAVVSLRQRDRSIRLVGEKRADQRARPEAMQVILTADRMLELIQTLETAGYSDPTAMRVESGLPRVRSIDLRVAGGRSSVAVTEQPHLAFDSMAAAIRRAADEQLWQLYRDPVTSPDALAFWQAERRWRDENPGAIARGRRLLGQAVDGWHAWTDELKARAIGFVAAHPERRELVQEQHGLAILVALKKLAAQNKLAAKGSEPAAQLTDLDLQLLEVAAGAPGERVWADCIEFAVGIGDGRAAVQRVFKVLGADAVLLALADERPVVRRAAIDEVVSVRDRRAAPRLLELLDDADLDVQRASAFALGYLKVNEASKPLVERIAAEETDPMVRRECLRALGRVGGELAFPVLQRAMTAPAMEDKQAALRGLGELRDPRAAHLLVEFMIAGHGKDLGGFARFHLQRQGAQLSVPALQHHIPLVRDDAIRAELVLLLGLWQEPKAVNDLMDLLRQPRHAAEAVPLLENTTGVDLVDVTDRVATIELWWRENKDLPQWQWLLDELARNQIETTLSKDDFSGTAGLAAVPELARLLVELEVPRLWVLCSAMLRKLTGQDYGVVSQQMALDLREGIAARYKLLVVSPEQEGTGR